MTTYCGSRSHNNKSIKHIAFVISTFYSRSSDELMRGVTHRDFGSSGASYQSDKAMPFKSVSNSYGFMEYLPTMQTEVAHII